MFPDLKKRRKLSRPIRGLSSVVGCSIHKHIWSLSNKYIISFNSSGYLKSTISNKEGVDFDGFKAWKP